MTSSGKKCFYCCVERVHTVVKNVKSGRGRGRKIAANTTGNAGLTRKKSAKLAKGYVTLSQHVERKPAHVSHPYFLFVYAHAAYRYQKSRSNDTCAKNKGNEYGNFTRAAIMYRVVNCIRFRIIFTNA
jgi:hypothetical protein